MSAPPRNRGHPLNPPIAWVGGKRSILDVVLEHFPLHFGRYIEVFGGSGVVLFGKEQTPFEVWNDYNNDLYNFFYCVKHKHLELLRELKFLPLCSRSEFHLMRAFLAGEPLPNIDFTAANDMVAQYLTAPESAEITRILTTRCTLGDISRAAAFFKINRLSYGAKMDTFSLQPCDLRQFYGHITTAHERIQRVVLENKDFGNILKVYDRTDAFFYIDPPYFKAEKLYAVEFSPADHLRLFQILTHKDFKGKWLLSYNNEDFIRWIYRDFPQFCFERVNDLALRYNPKAVYGEILIGNFDIGERGRQHQQLEIVLS